MKFRTSRTWNSVHDKANSELRRKVAVSIQDDNRQGNFRNKTVSNSSRTSSDTAIRSPTCNLANAVAKALPNKARNKNRFEPETTAAAEPSIPVQQIARQQAMRDVRRG
jgi:hypothetical protein